jgi:glycosyltransferase involved in cell wall biosynthesis
MKTYTKRIGFLVSYQTLVPHGGIGQFTKSFVELMTANSVKVDLIVDKAPAKSEFTDALIAAGANIVYPDESLSYTEHSAIFMYGDSFCYERMVNFRNATIKALSNNIYDSFVCNTYETVQVISVLGLDDCIQTIAYSHLESQIFEDTKNPFLPSVNALMRTQLKGNNIFIGTQSEFNRNALASVSAYHLPIPLPEKSLLEKYSGQRSGVLFIGRWEEGKNPELFLDVIEKTGLPAKILTNANGAKKFEDRLKKMNASFEIKISVIGEEKSDFIKSSRVAFNPSSVESFGIAFYEQLIQLPTIALEDMRWTNNFDQYSFETCTKQTAAQVVSNLYEKYDSSDKWYAEGNIAAAIENESSIFSLWDRCFESFESKKSNSNFAGICSVQQTSVKDYITSLDRKIICIDDVRSVLTNKHKFKVVYTDDNSHLSKDENFVPVETVTLFDALFG